MGPPRFTIGIPTYNRAGVLGRAIASALDQSWPDTEVVVADNASTDATGEVVRGFGGRVRYHRHPTNLGAYENFVALTAMASGEFFSWLQDDDLIHRDFARRAAEALSWPGANVYASYQVDGPSHETFVRPALYGPPVALDWMRGVPSAVEGSVVATLSVFYSFANPPTVAFRTDAVRAAVSDLDPGCRLFNERVIVSRAAAGSRVVVDPTVGGVFLSHPGQISKTEGSPERFRSEWVAMTRVLGGLVEANDAEGWEHATRTAFDAVAESDRRAWRLHPHLTEDDWARAHPVARRARELLVESLSGSAWAEPEPSRGAGRADALRRAKVLARGLTPPLAWDALRAVRAAARGSSGGSA